MKDRTPRLPNRIKLTHENGTVEYVTWERADDPVEPGTPLNKASLLTDETGSMVGLDDTGTVNDALGRIILSSVSETVARSELDDLEIQIGTAYANGSTAVKFRQPFSGVPTVLAFVQSSSSLTVPTEISATGFTVNASRVYVSYIAIYNGGESV